MGKQKCVLVTVKVSSCVSAKYSILMSSWSFTPFVWCWLAVAPDRGGGACGFWGVCEQSCSWGGAWAPQTAHGVPPGWPGAPPPGQRVHYPGAPAAWWRRVSLSTQHTQRHTPTPKLFFCPSLPLSSSLSHTHGRMDGFVYWNGGETWQEQRLFLSGWINKHA